MPIDDMPVGSIVAFAGPTNLIPSGWLQCNGDPIYARDFPDLCGIIQDYWGPVNAISGEHVLPDLRAMILRGVNGSRNDSYADPEVQIRVSHNGRPNDVASLQTDAFQGHFHSLAWDHAPSIGREPNNTDGGDERNGFYPQSLSVTGPTQGQDGPVRVSVETRPKNAYVYYIIKAKLN